MQFKGDCSNKYPVIMGLTRCISNKQCSNRVRPSHPVRTLTDASECSKDTPGFAGADLILRPSHSFPAKGTNFAQVQRNQTPLRKLIDASECSNRVQPSHPVRTLFIRNTPSLSHTLQIFFRTVPGLIIDLRHESTEHFVQLPGYDPVIEAD